jgi:hypothetical protein
MLLRHALVRRIGIHWAQHIVDRGAMQSYLINTTEISLAADEFLSDNPHRCGYYGIHVPGA